MIFLPVVVLLTGNLAFSASLMASHPCRLALAAASDSHQALASPRVISSRTAMYPCVSQTSFLPLLSRLVTSSVTVAPQEPQKVPKCLL